jgi:uncharacterized surface protein with fasciclin (FAS1) repeats
MTFSSKILSLALATGSVCFFSCLKDPSDAIPSIAGLVVADPAFSTLEDAAIRCDLVFALSNPNAGDPSGDFTVFAPDNTAFSRLGIDNGDDLAGIRTAFLTQTVLYHVSHGNLPGRNLPAGDSSASVTGLNRRFYEISAQRYINGSKIVATDVTTANGTVHVIDKVLLATGLDIVQSALALRDTQVFRYPELGILTEAVLYVEATGLLSASPGSPHYTVFAPTDAAFRQLGRELGIPLEQPADIRNVSKDIVKAILLNHVVADGGRFMPEIRENAIMTVGGGELSVARFSNGDLVLRSNGDARQAKTLVPDIQVSNGVVHLIDRVLLP